MLVTTAIVQAAATIIRTQCADAWSEFDKSGPVIKDARSFDPRRGDFATSDLPAFYLWCTSTTREAVSSTVNRQVMTFALVWLCEPATQDTIQQRIQFWTEIDRVLIEQTENIRAEAGVGRLVFNGGTVQEFRLAQGGDDDLVLPGALWTGTTSIMIQDPAGEDERPLTDLRITSDLRGPTVGDGTDEDEEDDEGPNDGLPFGIEELSGLDTYEADS